jgi:crossover junction endonuclease MUS81
MAKYPTPFHHPREAMCLAGIGEKIVKRLEDRMAQYCAERGIPMPGMPPYAVIDVFFFAQTFFYSTWSFEQYLTTSLFLLSSSLAHSKKARKQAGAVPLTPVEQEEPKSKKPRKASTKQYVPKFRSGSYAILLALLQASIQHDRRSLTKDEILVIGQKFAEASLANKEHGSFYSAWDSMGTLISKGLVYQNGKGYYMTGEGKDIAFTLKDATIQRDATMAQYFVRPNGEDAVNPNIQHRSPPYNPELPRAAPEQPRPTPRSKAAPKRAAPTYNAYDVDNKSGPSNEQGYGDWDDPDDDWGTPDPAPSASGAALRSNFSVAEPSNSYGSSSSSRLTGTSHQPLDVDNDWDVNEYDAVSPGDYASPQDDVSSPYSIGRASADYTRPSSSSASLGSSGNVPEPLPDLSKVPLPVLLEIAEAQRRGTVSEVLGRLASTSSPARSSSFKGTTKTNAPRAGPDAFPHLSVNTFSTATGANEEIQDIAQLAKFQPIYYAPGSFDIILVLDIREVRVQSDRDYFSKKLEEKGVQVITRALDIGDVLWIAKPKEPNLLLPKEVVLDHIVERKRMDDLVSSIKDGRFNEQKV